MPGTFSISVPEATMLLFQAPGPAGVLEILCTGTPLPLKNSTL